MFQIFMGGNPGFFCPSLGILGKLGSCKISWWLGFKKKFLFSKAFAAKASWRLVKTESMDLCNHAQIYLSGHSGRMDLKSCEEKWFLFCDMGSGLKSFSCNQ